MKLAARCSLSKNSCVNTNSPLANQLTVLHCTQWVGLPYTRPPCTAIVIPTCIFFSCPLAESKPRTATARPRHPVNFAFIPNLHSTWITIRLYLHTKLNAFVHSFFFLSFHNVQRAYLILFKFYCIGQGEINVWFSVVYLHYL